MWRPRLIAYGSFLSVLLTGKGSGRILYIFTWGHPGIFKMSLHDVIKLMQNDLASNVVLYINSNRAKRSLVDKM